MTSVGENQDQPDVETRGPKVRDADLPEVGSSPHTDTEGTEDGGREEGDTGREEGDEDGDVSMGVGPLE